MSLFRVIIFLAIVVLIIISIGGYVASSAGWLSEELSNLYTSHFSFVTGIASVVGLLAFASTKKIRSTDFESEELEKLQSLMKAAQDLESLESNKSQTEKQLLELERRKKLMELSIQKAGLVLFYKNQLERYEPVILSKIKGDHELQVAIKESIEARDKLSSLNEEIEKDENVELIKSILDKQNDENSSQTDDPILLAFDFVSKALTKFMRI
jgi:phage pi2 protein 07